MSVIPRRMRRRKPPQMRGRRQYVLQMPTGATAEQARMVLEMWRERRSADEIVLAGVTVKEVYR